MTKMFKKCSTDQRFIWKRNTIYEIGPLIPFLYSKLKKHKRFTNNVGRTWISFRKYSLEKNIPFTHHYNLRFLYLLFTNFLKSTNIFSRGYGYLDYQEVPALVSKAKGRSVTALLSASGLEGGSAGPQHYQKFDEKEKGIMTKTSFSSNQKKVGQIVTRTSTKTTITSSSKVKTESKSKSESESESGSESESESESK